MPALMNALSVCDSFGVAKKPNSRQEHMRIHDIGITP